MIVTKTPLRVTLGGGGSDLGPGGYCIAAAIDKYVTIAVTEAFDDLYTLRYSQNERVASPDEIGHRILRETIKRLNVGPGIEISSTADIPAGTGLGSSGAFTVGLVHALDPGLSRPGLARLACELDVGRQDQHAAIYGGVNGFGFGPVTRIEPIETTVDEHCALYWTGQKRASVEHIVGPDPQVAHRQAEDAFRALTINSVDLLGRCLLEQFRAKWRREPSPFHTEVYDRIIAAINLGAAGGKLVGAGGGGFILIAGDTPKVEKYMKMVGYRRVPFRFDHSGSQVIAR